MLAANCGFYLWSLEEDWIRTGKTIWNLLVDENREICGFDEYLFLCRRILKPKINKIDLGSIHFHILCHRGEKEDMITAMTLKVKVTYFRLAAAEDAKHQVFQCYVMILQSARIQEYIFAAMTLEESKPKQRRGFVQFCSAAARFWAPAHCRLTAPGLLAKTQSKSKYGS